MRTFIIFALLTVAFAQTQTSCSDDDMTTCSYLWSECRGYDSSPEKLCECNAPYIGCLVRARCHAEAEQMASVCRQVCRSDQCVVSGSSGSSTTGNNMSGKTKAIIAGTVSGVALFLIFLGILALLLLNHRKKSAAYSSVPINNDYHQSMQLQENPQL
eukprot:TRINITY_DN938_c0_g1_i4.p1 TRINITY_DN938_c0_g1~~TRINITY_DN938_c0_g1_i4.p1  ORF type:complete len:158 (+),score=12.19 TRINITY_DN938_c0_g1_i4:73-546(+)